MAFCAIQEQTTRAIRETGQRVVSETVEGVSERIDENALAQGRPTAAAIRRVVCDGLDGAVADALRREGFHDAMARLRAQTPTPSQGPRESASASPRAGLVRQYQWGGQVRMVPEEWTLPSVNVASGWMMWWMGDAANGIGPVRLMRGALDVGNRNKRQLCEWRCLFTRVERTLETQGHLVENPSLEEVQEMLPHAARVMASFCTPQSAPRCTQLRVGTLAKLARAATSTAPLPQI